MPDTGAPWNIPYVAGTDLVADWPTDNQAQAEAIADALSAVPGVKQIVSASSSTAFTTTSSTFVDVTNFTATITPTSATSDIILLANHTCAQVTADGSSWEFRFYDGSAAVGEIWANHIANVQAAEVNTASGLAVDSPASTSAITYTVQTRGTLNAARGLTVDNMTIILVEVQP